MLFRKVIRDLKQNAVQFLAIYIMTTLALVMGAGFNASDTGCYESAAEYLTETNYMDLAVTGGTFHYDDIAMLSNMEGIRYVNGLRHATGKTTLDEERLLVISYIDGNEVSKLHYVAGEEYTPGADGVWVEWLFAEPMGLKVGDTLSIQTENIVLEEEIKGFVYAPEYTYYVPNATYSEPAYGTHGFVYMDIKEAPGDDVYYDKLIIDTDKIDYQKKYSAAQKAILSEMRKKITERLDNKKLLVRIKTEDGTYLYLINSVDANTALSGAFAAIFLSVAMLGIFTTLTRLTTSQRIQIGTLKALGFSRRTIMLHYMSYSLIVALFGCICGIVIGTYTVGDYLNELSGYYYQNPYMRLQLSSRPFFMTVGACLLCILTTYVCTRKLLVQNASDILHPEPPKAASVSFLEKTRLWAGFSFATQWNVRDVSRNKLRTFGSIAGILISSMLIFTSLGFYETLKATPPWVYGRQTQAKYKMIFEERASYGTVYDYAKMYAGQMLEEKSATLYANGIEEVRTARIMDEGNLVRYQDADLEYIDLPVSGVMLTTKAAESLGVGEGDFIEWRIEGDRALYSARIAKICRASEQGIILSREVWEKELHASFTPNAILSNMTIPADLKQRREVEAVNPTATLRAAIETEYEVGYTISLILIVMAIVMGTIVLFNLGMLSYVEKVREIATLKVLGFASLHIRKILLQQNMAVTAVGAVLGLPVGYKILDVVVDAYTEGATDMITTTTFLSFAGAVFGTFLVSLAVNIYVTAKVNDIDMVEALKGVE